MFSRTLGLLFLLATTATAQFDAPFSRSIPELKVRIVFSDGGSCDPAVHVLVSGIDGPLRTALINTKCEVILSNVALGKYHITVTGRGFAPVDTDIGVDLASDREV